MKTIYIKHYLFLLLLSLFTMTACVKDASVYLEQDKKDVAIDDFNKGDDPSGSIEGELTPGIQLVKLKVQADGIETERSFKYFMPVSIDASKPISLIFYFHGSYTSATNPLNDIYMSNPLIQLAIRENCIIVFPAGQDTGEAVNWQNSDQHLPFVDAMVDFFHKQSPQVDQNRIYTCGHSSGGIFSFVLAYYRSDIFAAAVPVAGQMRLENGYTPERAVPLLAINGKDDDIVIHSAAFENIQVWANRVGGYFASDALVSDTLELDFYKPYISHSWVGGKADIEFYTIIDEGHGINWNYITPLIWDFMNSHPKNLESSKLYISSEIKSFDAVEGQTFKSEIRYTEGATLSVASAPDDWEVYLSGNILTVKAPNDFFAATTINRTGNIKLRVQKNGQVSELILNYNLQAPKTFFEIGDLIYDDQFNPTGVVFWVNPTNIKEAKMIALESAFRPFGAVGTDFATSSFSDGYSNTLALINRNKDLNLGLTAANSAFVYAYEYKSSPGRTAGWYLPAVDELELADKNIDKINEVLRAYGKVIDVNSASESYQISSTMVINGGRKTFYTFDFNVNPSWHGYYTIAANAQDDTFNISVRPIKSITKP